MVQVCYQVPPIPLLYHPAVEYTSHISSDKEFAYKFYPIVNIRVAVRYGFRISNKLPIAFYRESGQAYIEKTVSTCF